MSLSTDLLRIFSPSDIIEDKPYSEWLGRWWQVYHYPWILRNREKVFCVPGKVMEMDSKRKERYITIKQNKPILFTILNWIATDPENNKREEEMISECKERIDVVATNKQRFTIDDDNVNIKNQMDISALASRARSSFFTLNKHCKCITEGYWLFLKPYHFDKGDYTIKSFGTCSSGATQVEIDYHVFIR